MNENLESRLKVAKTEIAEAEYILIGGGSGLSAAAGLSYTGKRFKDNFEEFIRHYGITDMYSAGFYPFSSQEEKWAYWSKHIYVNRFQPLAFKLYLDLFDLVKDKKYFVITTNVDGQFYKAGFDKTKVFDTQGDYGKFQCAVACHNKLYDNEEAVLSMLANQYGCRIPTELIPKCPVCGGDMVVNLRKDNYFIEDSTWHEKSSAYASFLERIRGHKLVLLELGIGYNTPGIIRFPFEQITYREPNATLVRFNKDYPDAMKENTDKTISFTEDISLLIN